MKGPNNADLTLTPTLTLTLTLTVTLTLPLTRCILNSFYGYVMRRGARWNSMEMANP